MVMKQVYLDNAATTPIDPLVVEAMMPYLTDHFGNPSSTHSFGRKNKTAIELSRRSIAKHLNVTPAEIVFTSGGTEADNMAIYSSICDLGVKHLITSSIEHHAVGHTCDYLASHYGIKLSIVNLDDKGSVDLNHLEELLQTDEKTLVSLMHGNNEIGNMLSLEKVGEMCHKYQAYFHSDTVQTMGHYTFDLRKIPVDFITCAAHKFHGPKGVGFLYVNKSLHLKPLIRGGAQERNMRGGTENLYGIVGLAKAMDLAYDGLEEHQNHVSGLKQYMKSKLEDMIPGVMFNGDSASVDSLYTVLNVCLPATERAGMLLFSLDLEGVACSGGSACSSGSNIGSHVLTGINAPADRPSVRFSFSRFTTKEEIDFALEKLNILFSIPLLSTK
ncbi:MAG: cysteine desulfurase [Flavobacteriales bacterium]|jgi:cysteine desulfurase